MSAAKELKAFWESIAQKQVELEQFRGENAALEQALKAAQYYLRIYIHAHASGNSVPPNIEAEAKIISDGKWEDA